MKLKQKMLSLTVAAAMTLSVGAAAFAAEGDTGFSDVRADAWYADAVRYVQANGLMSGTSATAFAPESTITRSMLSVVLYRIAGSPNVAGTDIFPDTDAGTWYSDAVLWASQQGLISGYGNGLFGTNDPVSREQLAAILWRYAGSPAAAAGADFADESAISGFAASAVDWARANGIINGMSGNRFVPGSSATRAQVASILMNYRQNSQTPAAPETPETTDTGSTGKALVAYFAFAENIGDTSDMSVDAIASASLGSAGGNTSGNLQLMAQTIQETVGADVHHIVVAEAYDSDYDTMRIRAYNEMDNSTLPALQARVENLDQYDVIYLGTPVWGGRMPPAVASFLTENDLSGKTIIPFGIHMGSGFGSILGRIEELAPGSDILDGLTISARTANAEAQEDVRQWLAALNLN